MYLQYDDSFASYLALIRQSFSNLDADDAGGLNYRPVIGLVRKRRRGDYELDVFGAEKYYSSDTITCPYAADHGCDHEKISRSDGKSGWSSACSEYSGSTIVLRHHEKTPLALPATNRRRSSRSSSSSSSSRKKKTLLALFRFYCSKENAVDVADAAARCLQCRGKN